MFSRSSLIAEVKKWLSVTAPLDRSRTVEEQRTVATMAVPPALKRMAFVVEIARRLHQYGTSAPRLEDAIDAVSARLQLNCHSLSTPTSILFSFTDRASGT